MAGRGAVLAMVKALMQKQRKRVWRIRKPGAIFFPWLIGWPMPRVRSFCAISGNIACD